MWSSTIHNSNSDTTEISSSSDHDTSGSISLAPSSENSLDSSISTHCGLDHSFSNSDSDNCNLDLSIHPGGSSESQDNLNYSASLEQDDFRPWDDQYDDDPPVGHNDVRGKDSDLPPSHKSPIPEPSNSPNQNHEDEEVLSTVFHKHCTICLLYLQTVIANIFDSQTVLASNLNYLMVWNYWRLLVLL